MFWKKRDSDDLKVTLKSTDRSSHRVRPLSGAPLVLMIEGQPCRVYDISAGGVSFQSPRRVVAGDVKDVKLKLPYSEIVVEGRLRIVAVDQDQARGSFLDLAEEAKDQIHFYVLEVQKRRIKQKAKPDRTEPVP